eukprot:TRINITY_DN13330_c4_g1_i1.p1 TRINITY_DN13330_c4_g1~~TRINITY_DN13330_c4_g1_i1.p1  ORF type:complete len:261 (-),score=75.96 TRINITY_DN13330_c4_g1_i1:165-947(-)
MQRLQVLITSLLCFLPHCHCQAPEGISDEHLSKLFKMVDKDGNGKINHDDLMGFARQTGINGVKKMVPEIFDMIDLDKDGKLNVTEVVGEEPPPEFEYDPGMKMKAKIFKVADEDNDGFLTEAEYLTMMWPEGNVEIEKIMGDHFIEDRDKDGDQLLDLKEFLRYTELPEEFNHHEGYEDEQDSFYSLDKDGDNKLNVTEVLDYQNGKSMLQKRFASIVSKADKNMDHHVTEDELLDAAHQLHKAGDLQDFERWKAHHEL